MTIAVMEVTTIADSVVTVLRLTMDMMIAEEIAQTMIPEDNCTAQRYHVLGELKINVYVI